MDYRIEMAFERELSSAGLPNIVRRVRVHKLWVLPSATSPEIGTLPFLSFLWPPYVTGQAIIFLPCGLFLLLLFFLA